jgi:hypothetical protein
MCLRSGTILEHILSIPFKKKYSEEKFMYLPSTPVGKE